MHRPGIVGKLMLVSVVLLAIPLLTVRYLREMHGFVLDGQRNALQLAAQAVATVLHGREDLFFESGGLPFSPWDDPSCSALPLEAPVQLDGNARDWSDDPERICRYQRARSTWEDGATVSFDLRLGQRDARLYVLFEVVDDLLRFRHPRHRNLDGSDHIRITIPGPSGSERRYLITAEEPGALTAYAVGPSWRYAIGGGLPVSEIRGSWQPSPDGYTVEMRIPLEMLPTKRIGFAVADVDEGPLDSVVPAIPSGSSGLLHLVLLESPEIERILEGLALPGARISVLDARRRVRSELGQVPDAIGDPHRDQLIDMALDEGAGLSESGAATTAASSPIRAGSHIVGVVLIEQANDRILALPRRALERERNAILLVCVGIAVIFWGFAWRLAFRIHRLCGEAGSAIDADGRAKSVEIRTGRRAGDEIGDLSRTISGLLSRLSRYTAYLERVPSTLRHELSNPLNAVSTSLENLASERPELAASKYLRIAERGVARMNEIVESLTEPASLEEALRHDELERIDLAALIRGYVENFAASCPQRRFNVRGADDPLTILASEFRIEQLLDKLVDNAVAFSPVGSEITFDLMRAGAWIQLRVGNQGPLILDELRERVFESMFSTRETCRSGQPHLGLGLTIVRLITERLGGKVQADNRTDRSGPRFTVELPIAESREQ